MSWSNAQKATLQAYRRYAGMGDGEYREMLYRQTGERSSTAGKLRQGHFDRVMAVVEAAAELAEVNGVAVGKRPGSIRDWHYWRKRCRGAGWITTRQRREIMEHWRTACQWLSDDERTERYMMGVATAAAGRLVGKMDDLREGEASAFVEALKGMGRRLARQAAKREKERIEAKYGDKRRPAHGVCMADAGGVHGGGNGAAEGEMESG